MRTFQACGITYSLKPECPLEPEDFRKLSALAKTEKQIEETRAAFSATSVNTELKQLIQALQRDEAKIKRLRGELSEVLS